MFSTLLRRLSLLPGLAFLLLALGAAYPALATHMLGGELTYRYLDANGPTDAPLRYELTVTIYNYCGETDITAPRPTAGVGIYDKATGARVVLTATNYAHTTTRVNQTGMMSIPQTSLTDCISPLLPPGCTITGPSLPYRLQKFVGVVNLPMSTTGYYAFFTDGYRNADITNLYKSGDQGMTLYTTLDPPLLPNHSPVFSDVAVVVICANDTTFLLNNAVDADGDRLVYAFGRPYGTTDGLAVLPATGFTPPPPLVPYVTGAGYSPTTPFGTNPGNLSLLNASTGVAQYSATTRGKYAVAVDVSEYRTIGGQEILIGTTRRDLQLVVVSCSATHAPVLPPVTVTPRNYTIEAGSTLRVPITATQADAHDLTMKLNSVLLDGAGGYQAALNGNEGTVVPGNPTGTATVTGVNGVVTGTFVYTAGCGDARSTPYDVALTVKDNGCSGKTVSDVLHITVTRPSGPVAIRGDQVVCGLNAVRSYTAIGGTAPKVSWRVVGGTFISDSTSNPVQVKWTTTGTGTIVARGVTQYGCFTDSAALSVAVARPATVTISVQTTLPVCQGKPLTFSVDNVTDPGPGPQYQWQVDGIAVAGAHGSTFTSTQLRDGQIVTLSLHTTTACSALTAVSNAVRATISPNVNVGAGPDKTIIEGEQVVLEGRASGNYPVVWTPSQSLTFVGGNPLRPVASPLVTTVYTLSAGAGDCADSSPVTVKVLPLIQIPNAISPNGDGQDDTWEIDRIGNYPGNRVLVFNRWGSKIYETTNYSRSNEWNGTINGQPAPIGTYYYVITLGNGKSYSGPITVVY